jgi:hypothetical protein
VSSIQPDIVSPFKKLRVVLLLTVCHTRTLNGRQLLAFEIYEQTGNRPGNSDTGEDKWKATGFISTIECNKLQLIFAWKEDFF